MYLKMKYNYSYLCMAHIFFEISSKCFFLTKLSPKSYWIPIFFSKFKLPGIALQGFPVDELNLDGLKDQNLRLLAGHVCGSCVF